MLATRSTPRPRPPLGGAYLVALLLSPASCRDDDSPPLDDAAAGTGGSSSDSGTDAPSEDALTWWRDIEPIVRDKCMGCHTPGNIAPFSLETYDDFVTLAPAALAVINTGEMPPWLADDECNSYLQDRSLTPEQHDAIEAYVQSDMPEGDPADAPPPGEPPPELETTVALQMPEPYTPATGVTDDYRCFLLTLPPEVDDGFVTGFDVYPGEPTIVHHVIVYQIKPGNEDFYVGLDDAEAGPGYTCFGGPGATNGTAVWLGGWVPGMPPSIAPEGTGQPLDAGSTLVMQVHYNTLSAMGMADRSSLALRIEPSVDRTAVLMPFSDVAWLAGNGSMLIPAGDSDVMHEATMDRTHPIFLTAVAPILGVTPEDDLQVWSVGMHMHLFGKQGRLEVRDPGGGNEECLLHLPRWDFNWQSSYSLTAPVRWSADRELHLQCWWDNSAANQPVINGQPLEPADLDWGEGTLDEMCLGIFYVSAAD